MTSLGSIGQCAAIICGVNVFQLYSPGPHSPPVPIRTDPLLLKVKSSSSRLPDLQGSDECVYMLHTMQVNYLKYR